jgi:hypothetical protein
MRPLTQVRWAQPYDESMTTPSIVARGDRWFRAVGYGLLAELATILTIVFVVMLYKYVLARGLSDSDYTMLGERAGMIIGVFGGALYTFSFARRLMRRISSHFIAHGVVVALAAITLSIAGSIAGHQKIPATYITASVLKILGGALAGWIYKRYIASSPGTAARS